MNTQTTEILHRTVINVTSIMAYEWHTLHYFVVYLSDIYKPRTLDFLKMYVDIFTGKTRRRAWKVYFAGELPDTMAASLLSDTVCNHPVHSMDSQRYITWYSYMSISHGIVICLYRMV